MSAVNKEYIYIKLGIKCEFLPEYLEDICLVILLVISILNTIQRGALVIKISPRKRGF